MTQWYYQLLGEEFGPVSASSLRQLLTDGTLSESDAVRASDSAAWVSLSTAITDPHADARSTTQTVETSDIVTDLAELNFQFEESSAPALKTPVTRRSSAAVADRPAAPPQYYYQFFGQILGPIPLATLIRLAEAGRLSETDLVRGEGDFLWQAASEFSELSAAFLLRAPEKPAAPPVTAPTDDITSAAVSESAGSPPADSSPPATVQTSVTGKPRLNTQTSRPTAAESPGKTKRRRSGKQDHKAEERLVDNILSEVFAEEDAEAQSDPVAANQITARPSSSERTFANAPATPAAAATAVAAAANQSAAPRTWGSVSPAVTQSASSAPAARPAFKPASKSKSSRSGPWLPDIRIEFNGPVRTLLALGLLAAIWFGYTPLMRYFRTDEARYISRMELAIETCEKLNPLTEEAKFKGQQEAMKREFGAYAAVMTESGSTRESAKNCLGALNRMLEFCRVEPVNSGLQKKLLDEAKLLIKKYKGA
ncbi:MAG: hypothetical protein RLZZ436_2828 [Planctomycetota bacterium]|jgi:hypothetical protein